MKLFLVLLAVLSGSCLSGWGVQSEEVRRAFSDLVLKAGEEELLLATLSESGDPLVIELVSALRVGEVLSTTPEPAQVVIRRADQYAFLLSGEAYQGDPAALKKIRAKRQLRKKLSRVVSLLELASPDKQARAEAAVKLGAGQDPVFLEELQRRASQQPNETLRQAFEEGVSLSLLKNGDRAQQLAAIRALGELHSIPAKDFLKKIREQYASDQSPEGQEYVVAAQQAIAQIEQYEQRLEFVGTLFRGVSLGSVLLIVSYGLAITFGLMGVINMAHGEFIAIGAYTVYVVQNQFAAHFDVSSVAYQTYFLWSLPLAFFVPALFGILLERGVIRFLYNRPLESLLATWGISMVIQQGIRLIFGAANVQVSSPEWISGSYELGGVTMTYNRLFVILFSVVVVFMTWILLRRTRIGLQIRATMQNRTMASNLGIPANKINMLTFAYGSGLAGLAGAFLSQIGNVGASMGQDYIVSSFMVVVIGGVGNLLGAALSSLGIGMIDQMLQPVFGPVMGKISVLIGIILFLQWKPGGIFPSRSRSLDD